MQPKSSEHNETQANRKEPTTWPETGCGASRAPGPLAIWSIGERKLPAGRYSLRETKEVGQKEGRERREWEE